jgi:hypothetical protein
MVKHDAAKFALLGLPTVIVLLLWRRAGVLNRTMYGLSLGNPLTYVLWLVAIAAFSWMTPQRLGGWMSETATGMFVGAPIFGVLFSVVLLAWSIYVPAGQRWKMAVSNTCMLLLWLTSMIAPN